MPGKSNALKYPCACGILVPTREPTERERWIDLRPGAENPQTPTRRCGTKVADAAESDRHMASVHSDLWRTLQLLAEIRLRHMRGES